MRGFIEAPVILFAMVGLVALVRWIYQRGWGVPAKVVAFLVTASLAGAILSGPTNGRLGADHGALTDLIATFGMVILGTWVFRRFGAGWQSYALSAVTVLLLLAMWVPRYLSGELHLPSSGATSPTNGFVEPSSQPGNVRPSRSRPTRPMQKVDICSQPLSARAYEAAGCGK